jgi:DNA-cytosine methyltransferase
MRHLDLFSGIGGFALSAQTVWQDKYEPVAFCECDKFCQKVLKKHWPNVPICENIKDLFSWDIDKNVGICYSRVCEQLNNKKLIFEMLLSLMRQNSKEELLLCASIAGSKCPFLLAMQKMVEGSFAQISAGINIKEGIMPQMQVAANGCKEKIIRIGKTGKVESVEITENLDIKKPNNGNGEGEFLPGINTPVNPAETIEDTILTHIILRDGSIIQRDDLTYLMGLLYAKLATKKYICERKKRSVDILTAGFPCQPFSCAGKRKGTADDRWLWYDLLRIIRETKSTFLLLENVRGLLAIENGLVFEQVCLDLENAGYEVQTFIIPAVSVNAPHRRDRLWIVAYNNQWQSRPRNESEPRVEAQQEFSTDSPNACNAVSGGQQGFSRGRTGQEFEDGFIQCEQGNNTNSNGNRFQGLREQSDGQGQVGLQSRKNREWNENWLEVAQRFCQLDDGLPVGLFRCLTKPETLGIMGFILLLRSYYYAENKETRTREVLQILQEAFAQETVQECFGRLRAFYEPEVLRCSMYGKGDGESQSEYIKVSSDSNKIPKAKLRTVPNNTEIGCSPQGRRHNKQCSCEFDDIMFELSSEIALGEWKNNAEKAENILFDLWQKSRGQRFLYEPLPALYEIWKSITHKEIGTFRRHYNKRNEYRVQKLKSLGNAIVPQCAMVIMEAIKSNVKLMELENVKVG